MKTVYNYGGYRNGGASGCMRKRRLNGRAMHKICARNSEYFVTRHRWGKEKMCVLVYGEWLVSRVGDE